MEVLEIKEKKSRKVNGGGSSNNEVYRVVISKESNDALESALVRCADGFDSGSITKSDVANYIFQNINRFFLDGDVKNLRATHFDEKKMLYISKLSEEAGTKAAEHILKMSSKPDAVFSANDTAAVYCMIKLKEAGIRIPRDIAFAGFNNDPISKIIEPNLTTVNYSGYDIGETAVNILINHLNGVANVKTTNMIILRSDVIVRASSLKK